MKDALKEISKCKEEGRSRLDISKSQITTLPTNIKELASNLKELYLYSNKLINLPSNS